VPLFLCTFGFNSVRIANVLYEYHVNDSAQRLHFSHNMMVPSKPTPFGRSQSQSPVGEWPRRHKAQITDRRDCSCRRVVVHLQRSRGSHGLAQKQGTRKVPSRSSDLASGVHSMKLDVMDGELSFRGGRTWLENSESHNVHVTQHQPPGLFFPI